MRARTHRGTAAAVAASFALSLLAVSAVPSYAVDRSLGAGVPKPAATGAPWSDAEIAALSANVDIAVAGSSAVRGAHVGVYAIDARDGRALYQRNADDNFQPASTFKLLVGSAALEKLGPAFRFHTEVVANGPVVNGSLQGALVLRGGGDPFLNAADLDAAAAAVSKAGIARTGPLFVDDSRYETPGYLPGWNWDDFPYYYAPVVSALTFEENVVHLTIAPGAKAGDAATVTAAPIGTVAGSFACRQPTAAVVIVATDAQTGAADAKDTIDLQRDRSGCIRVAGTIPAGAKPDTVDAAVPSPAVYAHDAFVAALKRHGVEVSEPNVVPAAWPFEHRIEGPPAVSPVVSTTLWSHDSEPLSDVLADLWLPSDNLVAELLLRELGFAQNGAPGTTAHGVAFEQSWLKTFGVDPTALAIEDGSGLSGYDRISPRALVAILKHDWDSPNRDLVLDDLPLAGVRGTLKSSYTGTAAEKHVFAKTGSISHVSTLAGYAANVKHGAVIFAFQVDDWVGEAAALRDLRARILSRFVED
jgi:D-alanyl-D-alanine carboxypeptidase/D-alanyl-D-alanine-endopeptidase (penicillin-binding protein 4)